MNIALKIKIVEITMNFILNSFKIAQILILSMGILIWLLWIQFSLLYCRNSYFKCDSHFKFKECSRSDVYYCLHTDASLFFYEKCTMYTHFIGEKDFFLIFFSPEMNILLVFFQFVSSETSKQRFVILELQYNSRKNELILFVALMMTSYSV